MFKQPYIQNHFIQFHAMICYFLGKKEDEEILLFELSTFWMTPDMRTYKEFKKCTLYLVIQTTNYICYEHQ